MGKKAINSYTRAQTVALYNNSKSLISMDKVAKRLNILQDLCLQRHQQALGNR